MDVNGATSSTEIPIEVGGEAKVGVVRLSFVDFQVPAAGLDLEVIRSYDSRVKSTRSFGVGWDLAIRAGSFDLSRSPSLGWSMHNSFPPPGLACAAIDENGSHYLTVRLSDHESYTFRQVLHSSGPSFGTCFGVVTYDFVSGFAPGATLDLISNPNFYQYSGQDILYDDSTNQAWAPQSVLLTTPDGRLVTLDSVRGATRVEDLSGNAVDINPTGLVHSSGRNVAFVRDAQGRISQIQDSATGSSVSYAYDGRGDLVSVTDPAGATTAFSYDDRHNLLQILNPLGIEAARNEYDAGGRLTAIVDAHGNRIEFDHDITGRVEVRRDRLGRTTREIYNTRGDVTSRERYVTLNGVLTTVAESFTFDTRGNKLTETDALGHVTSFFYDAANNLTQKTDPLGHVWRYAYDSRWRRISETDPLGHTSTTSFDVRGVLTLIRDSSGVQTTVASDDRGLPISATDVSGTQHFVNDALGNHLQETNRLGVTTTFTYDALGNALTEQRNVTTPTGSRSEITTSTYDSRGSLTSRTNAAGETLTYEYDALGRRVATTDPLGFRTEIVFDALNRAIQTLYSDGTTDETEYDAVGNVIRRTDRAGRSSFLSYDELGRLVEEILPDSSPGTLADNARRNYEYDLAGRKTAEVDEFGTRTEFTYDAAGRRTRVRDSLGHETVYTYDAADRRISTTDRLGHATTLVLDAAGRELETHYADGSVSTNAYDSAGRLATSTDELGRVTHYEHDAEGRLAGVVDAAGNHTIYRYDEAGRLTEEQDALGRVTRHEYDAAGRETAVVGPLGQRATIVRNAAGGAITLTNAAGQMITQRFDPNGEIAERRYPDGSSVVSTYTAEGLLESFTDARGTTALSHDPQGRLTQRTEPDGRSLQYVYGAQGRLQSLTTPAGAVSYGYDSAGRLSTVTDTHGVTTYGYNAENQLTTTQFPNGVVETRGYDLRGRLTSIEAVHAGTTINRHAYSLNAAGERTHVDESDGRAVTYGYDVLGRLTSETIVDPTFGNRTIGYAYDAVGNRVAISDSQQGSTVLAYDANDQLVSETTSAGVTTSSYDTAGRLTRRGRSSTDETRLTWDADDRLVSAEVVTGTATWQASYRYDMLGNRMTAIEAGVERRFLVDEVIGLPTVVMDSSSSGSVRASYTLGAGRISETQSSATRYYHGDAVGTVRTLSDSSGARVGRRATTAFGVQLGQTGVAPLEAGFLSEPTEARTGLVYLRARYYQPSAGRFVSTDPVGPDHLRPQTLGRYAYAINEPVGHLDPTGRFSGDVSEFAATDAISSNVIAAENLSSASYFTAKRIAAIAILGLAGPGLVISPKTIDDIIQMRKRGERRRGFSLFIPGGDTPDTTTHIAWNIRNIPINSVLTRFSARPKAGHAWYRGMPECVAGFACDEYPFYTTVEGGPENYPTRVTLAPTPGAESVLQGGLLNGFYSSCQLPDGARFGVQPVPKSAVSAFICGTQL